MGLHVARQLVGSREALIATREITRMGLLASVGADMTCLMLQTEEGLVAEMAFVGARDLFWCRFVIGIATCGGGSRRAAGLSRAGAGRGGLADNGGEREC